jgi:hypothetical protein
MEEAHIRPIRHAPDFEPREKYRSILFSNMDAYLGTPVWIEASGRPRSSEGAKSAG